MRKSKKVLGGVMAFAMAATLIPATAFAAETSSNRPAQVSYNSSSEIPDPENPTNPQWTITVPASIVFTDEVNGRTPEANVTLARSGGAMELPTNMIKVEVASKHGYVLYLDEVKGKDDMNYSLSYEDPTDANAMLSVDNGTNKTVLGYLNKDHAMIKSNAELVGDATATGPHTDTLTYTITTGVVAP